jgi:GxxExxY protein
LESAYEECLFYELNKFDILVERQKPMPLVYDEVKMDIGYRLDFLIEKKICAGNKIHRIITRYSFSTNTYIPSPK